LQRDQQRNEAGSEREDVEDLPSVAVVKGQAVVAVGL
jgi:hypothetical protein